MVLWLTCLGGKELQDCFQIIAANWKAEAAFQCDRRKEWCSGKVRIGRQNCNPLRFAAFPDSTRQSLALGEYKVSCGSCQLFIFLTGEMPDRAADQLSRVC